MSAELRATLRDGVTLHQQGRVREALARYRDVLAAEPGNPHALNFAGAAEAALGNAAAAVGLLDRAVRAAPDSAPARANLGLALRAVGRHEEAADALAAAAALAPDDAGTHNELGITLRRLGRYRGAVDAYRRAIAIDAAFAEAHANLGNVLQDLDRMEDAVESYRAAIRRGACQPSVHRGLGNALQRLGDLEAAERAYRAALERDPDYVAALVDLGGTLVELGRADDGVACLRRAAALAPRDATVHSNLGMGLHEAGEPRAALSAFDRALTLSPGNTHALAYKTITLHELGERDEWRRLVGLERFVRKLPIEPPHGYPSVAALNRSLAAFARAHPSVWTGRRRGISSELFLDGEGSPLALREAIRGAVERYVEGLPDDPDHPFVARRPERFVLSGWCNILESGGAASHVHPGAWLSGVYYVETAAVAGDGVRDRGGVAVGAPDDAHYRTDDYEVTVFAPEEGSIVVFPSYVWHRILPFEGGGERISYAFDVVPAA